MVAVVGAPADCQLGHVASSHHQAIACVCQIEQNLRAFPGLRVFIDNIMLFWIVPNILEMLQARILDANLAQFDAEFMTKSECIFISPVCRPKAWHRHGNHIGSLSPQDGHCPDAYQQRQRRIKTSGNPQNQLRRMSRFKTLAQTGDLKRKYVRQLIGILGDKWGLRQWTVQRFPKINLNRKLILKKTMG